MENFQTVREDIGKVPFESDPEQLFTIVERLGKGSFGAVYKGIFKKTGSIVALKKCIPEEPEEVRQEIEIMKECEHENIIFFFGSFFYDGMFWIVMEYCALGALTDVFKLNNVFVLNEVQVASVCKCIINGLEYLHRTGKIHRDIKPENLLLTTDGSCKLADFGVAGRVGTFNKRSTLTGTPYYIAPEILQEDIGGYDARADVWSLGICAIEFAEGHPPLFQVNPMKVMLHILKDPPPTLIKPKDFSREFAHFLYCCLQKDPSKRPSSAQLLQHPFITNAQPTQVSLAELVNHANKEVQKHGGLERALHSLKGQKDTKNFASSEDLPPPPEDLPPPPPEDPFFPTLPPPPPQQPQEQFQQPPQENSDLPPPDFLRTFVSRMNKNIENLSEVPPEEQEKKLEVVIAHLENETFPTDTSPPENETQLPPTPQSVSQESLPELDQKQEIHSSFNENEEKMEMPTKDTTNSSPEVNNSEDKVEELKQELSQEPKQELPQEPKQELMQEPKQEQVNKSEQKISKIEPLPDLKLENSSSNEFSKKNIHNLVTRTLSADRPQEKGEGSNLPPKLATMTINPTLLAASELNKLRTSTNQGSPLPPSLGYGPTSPPPTGPPLTSSKSRLSGQYPPSASISSTENKERSPSYSLTLHRRSESPKKAKKEKKTEAKKGLGKIFSKKKEDKNEKQEIMAFLYGNE